MNIIKSFNKGMFNLESYSQLIKLGAFRAIINVFLVSIFSLFFLLIPFGIDYLKLGGITGAMDKYIPEFTIENGVLTTDKYYKKEFEGLSVIIIDASGKYTEQDLLKYESGLIITKDKVLLKYLSGECNVQSYDTYEKAGITNKKAMSKFVPIIKLYIVIIVFCVLIFVFVQNMFFTAILAMLSNAINFFLKKNLSFGDTLAVACYATALPTLAKYLITSASQIVSTDYYFSMPLEIYIGLSAIYCYLAIKAIKAKKSEN